MSSLSIFDCEEIVDCYNSMKSFSLPKKGNKPSTRIDEHVHEISDLLGILICMYMNNKRL